MIKCDELKYINLLLHLCNDISSTSPKAAASEAARLTVPSDHIPNQLRRYDVPQGNGFLAHQLGAVCRRRAFPSRVQPGVQLMRSMSRRV